MSNNHTVPPGIVVLFGPPNTMKTTMALSWPSKVVVFDFDLGTQRAWKVNDLVASGKVQIHRMPLPIKSMTTRYIKLEGYMELWSDFVTKLEMAMQDITVQTVIIDTSTVAWKLCCDAFLQELQQMQMLKDPRTQPNQLRKQLQQIEYGEPNARMSSVFNAARSYQKWLVLVSHIDEEYATQMVNGAPAMDENGQPRRYQTGKKIPEGFKKTEPLADWEFKTADMGSRDAAVGKVQVVKSAAGIDLVGLSWGGPELKDVFNFQMLERNLNVLGRLS